MTRIINLYGGPGTGKSTLAADVYARLKRQGFNAELVREYVKNWAWEGRAISVYDQIYFAAKQIRYESMLFGKVDFIVTDSPVWLAGFYARYYDTDSGGRIAEGIEEVIQCFHSQASVDGHAHDHILLERTKPYNTAGRYQDEATARRMDSKIYDYVRSRPKVFAGRSKLNIVSPTVIGPLTEEKFLDTYLPTLYIGQPTE